MTDKDDDNEFVNNNIKVGSVPLSSLTVNEVISLMNHLHLSECCETVKQSLIDGASLSYVNTFEDFKEIKFPIINIKARKLFDLIMKYKVEGVPISNFNNNFEVSAQGSPMKAVRTLSKPSLMDV